MNKFLRALIAGYGAKKLGGGCLSTVLIFLVIYWALGNCNSSSKAAPDRPATLILERSISITDHSHHTGLSTLYLFGSSHQLNTSVR